LNLHNNNGEIVSWTEYLVGWSNNRYQIAYRPPSRRGRYNSYRTTAATGITADSIGDFRPVGVQGQGQGQQQQQQYQPYPQQQYQAPPPRTITPQNDFASISRRLALTDQIFQPQPIPQPRPEPIPPLQSQPTRITTAKKNEWGLSSETILKLAELKSRLYRHSNTFPDFEIIIQGAKYFAMMGDNSFLEEKLEQLRSIDAIR
jgi:hypothetical protein